jgi:hypothetical protein
MGMTIYHGWYDRAKTVMHHRMGDKVVQDYGLSRKQCPMHLVTVK